MKLPSLSTTRSKIVALALLLAIGGGIVLFIKMRGGASPEKMLARAEAYLADGELESAKILYRKVLQSEPKNATAFSQLGMIWAEQGSPVTALAYLLEARRLGSESLETRIKLGQSLISVGDFVGARTEAEAMLEQDPDNGEALHLLATSARSAEELDAAEQRIAQWAGVETATVHLAAATVALRKKDQTAAESAIKKALALEPNSARAHVYMGNLHAARGELDEAEASFRAAAEHAPRRSGMRLRQAEFKMQTGKPAEARAMLEEITADVPDFIAAWYLMAQMASREGEFDETLELLENIFRQDPPFFPGRLLQAQALLAKGDSEGALNRLQDLKKSKPFGDGPIVDFHLAQAYLLTAAPTSAVDALEQAVGKNPNYTEANLLLAQLNLRAGKPEGVVASMSSLLDQRPDLMQAQLALADAYRMLGRLDDAAEIFRAQIGKEPEAAQPQIYLGIVLRQQEKRPEARAAFEKASELQPDNPVASRLLMGMDVEDGKMATREAKTAMEEGDKASADEKKAMADEKFEAALKRAQKQLDTAPESASAHFMLGGVHFARESWDEAEHALLKAIELAPDSSQAYDLLVQSYEAANKLPEALVQLERRLADHPQEVTSLLRAAKIYEMMGKPEKARDAYETVIEANPDSGAVHNNLAWLYSEELGQLDKAYEAAQKARTALPEAAAVADTLGWILYKRGEFRRALFHIREASAKLPDDPQVQFHLGMASYMMAETAQAHAALQKAISLSDDFSGREDAQKRLGLLDELADARALSVAELEAHLVANERDVLLLLRLGAAFEKAGEAQKAAASFAEALKVNPELLSALKSLAQLYAGPLADQQKALTFAEQARKLAPDDPAAAGTRGKIAFQNGNFDLAYSLLQESARARGDHPATLFDFAWASYSLGKVDEARQTMQRLVGLAVDSPLAAEATSFLALTVADPSALAALEPEAAKALAKNPEDVPALMVRVASQMRSGDLAAAELTLAGVLKRFPNFAPAQKQLAALLVERPDKLDEALELATKARKTLGDDIGLQEVFAAINYKKNNFGNAIKLLNANVATGALSARSLFYLGMSYKQEGNESESQRILKQALAAGLGEPQAGEAGRALKEMSE